MGDAPSTVQAGGDPEGGLNEKVASSIPGSIETTPISHDEDAPKKKPLAFHLSFAALALMSFITSLDATSLSIALPTITSEMDGTTLEAFWANISFLLAMVVSQPCVSCFSHIIGRIAPLYASLLLFGLGSIVFAVAHSMSVVILGRILQGLGAGGIDVLAEIIIADMTTLKERPLYLGLFGLPLAAGSILGPFMGALFSQLVSWRWLGWINLPIIAIALTLIALFLRLRSIELSLREKLRQIDVTGLLLFAGGCTAFTTPLSWADTLYPWASWNTLVPLIIGLALLVIFAFYESRPRYPIFPYRIFQSRTAVASLVGALIHGLLVYCSLNYLSLFFQVVNLDTPLNAALLILPLTVSTVVLSVATPILVQVTRKYRTSIWLGWILLAVGGGLLALMDASSSKAKLSGIQLLAGAGSGVMFSVLVLPLQASLKDIDDTGIAVGLLITFRLLGGLIGLAIGSAIFANIFQHSIEAVWEDLPAELLSLSNQGAVSFIPELRNLDLAPETLASIIDVYTKSFRGVWYFLAAMGALGFFFALALQELEMEKEDMGRQRFEAPTGTTTSDDREG